MRTLRKSSDRVISGVAAGFAEYLDIDVTLMRAIWLFGCIAFPPAILAYFVLAAGMPGDARRAYQPPKFEEPEKWQTQDSYHNSRNHRSYRRLAKSPDKWISGVCGGVAEYFEVDPMLVRALWLVAVLAAGTGVALYIILAIIMPKAEFQYR